MAKDYNWWDEIDYQQEIYKQNKLPCKYLECEIREGKEMDELEKAVLEGATIIKAEVDGYGVMFRLDNGYVFEYDATDGGYSTYSLEKGDENE